MDKEKAIKLANEKRRREHEDNFADKVECLLYNIGEASNRLRDLKRELTDLEYEDITDLSG